jgi:hypothetical protein
MATRAKITPSLLAAVMRRRAAKEPWKVIARDLREAGLPEHRQQYHEALDPEERRRKCRERARAWRAKRAQGGMTNG